MEHQLKVIKEDSHKDDQGPKELLDTTVDKEFSMEKSGEELEAYIQDITDTVRIGLDQSIAILTPWFFNNMPRTYYQTTPKAEKVRHLSAVITGHVFETKQTVELWDRERAKVTYIGPGGDPDILVAMAKKLETLNIKMGSVYFSRDKLLFLSNFFRNNYRAADPANRHTAEKISEARRLLLELHPEDTLPIDNYIKHLDADYVVYATPARLAITFRMLRHMLHHEGAHSYVEPFKDSPNFRLMLGLKGVTIAEVLEQILFLIGRYGFEINRAFVIHFSEGYAENINVMHFVMRQRSGEPLGQENLSLIKLTKALRTLSWVDTDNYVTLAKKPFELSLNAANLIRSMASWVHVLLGKENSYYYSEHKIYSTFMSHPTITTDLADLFRIKFSPLKENASRQANYDALAKDLAVRIEQLIDRVEMRIFRECLNFTNHVLKTNYFLNTKTGLAFRLSGEVLDSKYYPQKPYGIFFVTGRNYRFFQVRWKDIARGGLRVVMPRSSTDYGYALSGLFDEVYGLSHAQQLKNKDIPEGGSKAVLVLDPKGTKGIAVRGGINAMLDLLVKDDESHEEDAQGLISYYPKEEIIYLGPDENMTNDLIVWVTEQAKRRGYLYADAFISSKPGGGINHKQYGVTSEGLHVYVDHTLRFLGIDPAKEIVTIKMTGGPDGDVAGNELKILYREYGENARIVAVADGYGAAYDEKGLNWPELLRLVEEEKSICEFDQNKLSGLDSFVISADTSENIKRRNLLHAVTKADIFIPAGGRPYTVNEVNYKLFLDENGEPTCRAIIEGANIFFTTEARQKLQSHGIYMIKDSSANKTGVICSSFEIIASLILSEEEFLEIKDVYVEQVVEILRDRAASEARLLFYEYTKAHGAKDLVTLSMDISKEINYATDLLLDRFTDDIDRLLSDPKYQCIVTNHCPKILQERYGERILERLPKAHQVAIIAAFIASYIVYQEGLGWLTQSNEDDAYKTAILYMHHKQIAEKLIDSVADSKLAMKGEIMEILRRSAARDLTMWEFEKSR